MERRTFLALLQGSLLAAPLIVDAQQAGSVPRIGYLGFAPSGTVEGPEAFRQALRELGRVDGQNITIEYRSTGGKGERAPELVAELIQLKVDLIYTPGSVATAQAAQRATTTIPIVFYTPADPVKAGLVASLARPGGNITGLTGSIQSSKRFSLLKEVVPQAARVAILWNPNNPVHKFFLNDIEDAARSASGPLA
jgi:putative ABC transport system substrate-binding protein